MAGSKEDLGIYHLTVGTEVSAKYRGAFCEAQIKSVRKNVSYKVLSKKTARTCHLTEENIRGTLRVGSTVECLLPDQTLWQDCLIQSAKDKSSYTVVFDDGDERTLSRGSLCLKGDRHYAKSETLDNLPLTDPENFGTPVVSMKKRRRRPPEDEYEDESEDQKTPERERAAEIKEKKQAEEIKEESSSGEEEDDDDKRKRWLADPLMGKVVIIEPNDKRKHWFPGLVVNPLCYERHNDLTNTQLVVRSFKTGKFLRVYRSSAKELTPSVVLPKLDSLWKGIIEDAQNWQKSRIVSDRWRIDIKDILSDSEEEDSDEESSGKIKKKDENEKKTKKEKVSADDEEDKEEEKKNHDFLEVLYKFMDDKGTPINKTPVLGYKDLDLYFLYKLVQEHKGSYNIKTIKEWKQIYSNLGIPKPNPAAGYNVRTAYGKYLGGYEEYCASWAHLPLPKPTKEKRKYQTKKKEDSTESTVKKDSDNLQDQRKLKLKEKIKSFDSSAESKTRGRSSPVMASTLEQRRGPRRRMSESSSDVVRERKPSGIKSNRLKKHEEKLRNPGGPDSEPDETSRLAKTDKKESGDKKITSRQSMESIASKRIRRNSTSSVSTQYVVGAKLKVKYGQGKTFKLYTAKVLQVKLPEGPGEITEYLVHYAGWNARHDELIKPHRIVGVAEDRPNVPQSPNTDIGKTTPRRPKTPLSARSSPCVREDIAPSDRLSVQLLNQLDSPEILHVKDDLPTFTMKPRVPIALKKNLSKDFAASDSSSDDVKRPTSPVLTSSQRYKRPKSPVIAATIVSKMTKKSEDIKEKSEDIKEKSEDIKEKSEDIKEKSEDIKEKSEDIEEKLPQANIQDDKEENISEEVSLKEAENEKESVEDSGSNNSKSEELSPRLKNDVAEESISSTQPDTPPIQQLRRTSSRRSKSPAYLLDSSWYNNSKRRKCSSSTENSPSPVESNLEKEDADSPLPSSKRSRSPSPSLSTSSSNSLSSGDVESKEKSPVPLKSTPTAKTADVAKPKPKRKSKKFKSENEQSLITEKIKLEKETENSKVQKTQTKEEQTPASEYDNFDEEAPSIALEKHKESALPESLDEKTIQSITNLAAQEKMCVEAEKIITSLPCDIAIKVAAGKKEEDTNNNTKSNKRKIRKRRATGYNANNDDAAKESEVVTPKTQKIETPDPLISKEDTVLPIESNTTQETADVVMPESIEEPSEPVSSGNENDDTQLEPPLHILPIQPPNPPSSSKVLLDNTPPTTPEQSPAYVSEDQDIDTEKHSPSIDSEDIEHKDSGGSSSSSGCEQPSSSGNTVIKSHDAEQQSDNDNKLQDKEIPTPSSAKKRRSEKKRTASSKNRRNQRSNNENIQESESEEEADNETGETNGRKRHESGSRCKPRKKRAKARPEPPSAPPPLAREELESVSQDERIVLLQSRMAEMRKVYHQLKQEVANIDRKRKRAKRREKEAAEAAQLANKRAMSPLVLSKASAGGKVNQEAGHLPANAAPCGQSVTTEVVGDKSEVVG